MTINSTADLDTPIAEQVREALAWLQADSTQRHARFIADAPDNEAYPSYRGRMNRQAADVLATAYRALLAERDALLQGEELPALEPLLAEVRPEPEPEDDDG